MTQPVTPKKNKRTANPRPRPRTTKKRTEALKHTFICRDIMHAWAPYDAGKTPTGWFRVLKCNRCETKKTQRLDSNGDMIGSASYSYPDSYKVPGGAVTPDERRIIRMHHIDQMLKKEEKEEVTV